jgi:hypothetical protein
MIDFDPTTCFNMGYGSGYSMNTLDNEFSPSTIFSPPFSRSFRRNAGVSNLYDLNVYQNSLTILAETSAEKIKLSLNDAANEVSNPRYLINTESSCYGVSINNQNDNDLSRISQSDDSPGREIDVEMDLSVLNDTPIDQERKHENLSPDLENNVQRKISMTPYLDRTGQHNSFDNSQADATDISILNSTSICNISINTKRKHEHGHHGQHNDFSDMSFLHDSQDGHTSIWLDIPYSIYLFLVNMKLNLVI